MADTTKVTVAIDEPIGTINPNLYGHFAEHLGRCIYEGVWVGEDSAIPHTDGIRDDVVAALKRLNPHVLRWPGGCFADDYHWDDGVGPRAKRPRRVNVWWGEEIETNEFGTHEFIELCRRIGAAPYVCGNVGSGSPRELRDWVEYCNFAGDSTLALRRAANGSAEPFAVEYWGVGNENWGCGGDLDPEDYAKEYRRFSTYLRDFGGQPLFLIACGPAGNNAEWTRRFFEKLGGRARIHGYAAHYYCGTAGTATRYTKEQWYELLWRANQMEPLIVQQRAIMDGYDPERRIGLIVDEWGTWHPPTHGHHPRHLWQQNTIRDALVAALTLDTFNRQADKVVMGNIAQTINVLQAMVLTDGDKMITTPTYHVYEMYKAHQGATAVRIWQEAEEIDFGGKRLFGLAGSASVSDESLLVTLVNPHATDRLEVTIEVRGGAATDAQARVLAADHIHAHNTFHQPNVVAPATSEASVTDGRLRVTLPPASVTALAATTA